MLVYIFFTVGGTVSSVILNLVYIFFTVGGTVSWHSPFVGNPRKNIPKGLPFTIEDYLELVDLTGRCIHQNKPGYIDNAVPCVLTRLNISPENWLELTTKFEDYFKGAVGSPDAISKFCQNQKLKRRRNIGSSKNLFDVG